MKKMSIKFSWKTCVVFLGTLVLMVFVFSAPSSLIPQAFAGASSASTTVISVTVNQAITLSLSTTSIAFGSLTPGIPATSTFSATVTTNAPTGFTLTATRPVASTTAIASGSITFADATLWNGSNATSSTVLGTANTSLAFREFQTGTTAGDYNTASWGTSDADPSALYAGFPTASTPFASTSSYVGTPQTIYAELRANAATVQQATTYTGTITITALGQP